MDERVLRFRVGIVVLAATILSVILVVVLGGVLIVRGKPNPRMEATQRKAWILITLMVLLSVLAFIYYNNRFFGGTRNEYRLTRMTQYMREHGIKAGDELVFFKDGDAVRRISYQRAREIALDDRGVLQLGRGWKVIDFVKRSR